MELYIKKNETKDVLSATEPKSQRTAMHIAAKAGRKEVIRFLLSNRASIDTRDKMLKTPLHYACEYGHKETVEYLINRNADPFEEDNCGRNALHYAIYSSQVDIVMTLTLEYRDLVKKRDHAGRTALHHAVFMETQWTQKKEARAEDNVGRSQADKGQGTDQYQCSQGDVIRQLIQDGSDVNALDQDKRTPLHHAAESNNMVAIEILIQNNAHTSLKDSLMKKTPLELASSEAVKRKIIKMSSPDYRPGKLPVRRVKKKVPTYEEQVNKI